MSLADNDRRTDKIDIANKTPEFGDWGEKATAPTPQTDDWWISELLGVGGSGVAIAGIAILLYFFDGLPTPTWSLALKGRHALLQDKAAHISLNAILALLSTVARICILIPITKGLAQLKWVWLAEKKRTLIGLCEFEAASRQSLLNSLKLLRTLRGRHFAVLGAVAVILSQGFDFFVQNLVTYPVESQIDPSLSQPLPLNSEQLYQKWQQAASSNPNLDLPSALQSARISNTTYYGPDDVGGGPYYNVDSFMKSNIWAAIYADDPYGNWAIPSYFCSSGNCTWSSYTSLGVCTRCADLTSQLLRTCTSKPGIDPAGVTGCDVSLPNGFSLGGTEDSRYNLMAMNTSTSPLVYTNYSSPIAIVQSITAYDTFFVNASTQINASECALVPCVLSYDYSSVYEQPSYAKNGFNGIAFSEYAAQIWDNYSFDTSRSFPYDGPVINAPVDGQGLNYTSYLIRHDAYLGLMYYIEALFNGFVSSDGNHSLFFNSDNRTQKVRASSEDAMQATYQAPSYCADVYGNVISDWNMCTLSMLSIGMTTIMRNSVFNLTMPLVVGQTYVNRSTIVVAWLWIFPLVILWLMSLIVLIGTVLKTRRSGVRTWRGDPLALVFLNLGNQELQDMSGYGLTDEGLLKKAKALQVQLHLTDNKAELA